MGWIEFLVEEIKDEETNLKLVNSYYTDPKTRDFYKRYTESKLKFLKKELTIKEKV